MHHWHENGECMYKVKVTVRFRDVCVEPVRHVSLLWTYALDWLYEYVDNCEKPENIEKIEMQIVRQ